VSGQPTHTFGVGTPGMTNMRGPRQRGPPQMETVIGHPVDAQREGFNNEDLIKRSHASYVAYANRYNTVYQ